MAGFLRHLTLLNTGLWLGAAAFMFLVALTIFTAPEMNDALQTRPEKGLAGQIFFQRFYLLQYVCAGAASLLLFLEWKLGKLDFPKWRFGLLVLLSGLVLAGGLWLNPKLGQIFQQKYPGHFFKEAMKDPNQASRLEEKAKHAADEHDKWHRISEGGYGASMLLLLAYFAANCRQLPKPRRSRKPSQKIEFTL
jgi:hypothetical protein